MSTNAEIIQLIIDNKPPEYSISTYTLNTSKDIINIVNIGERHETELTEIFIENSDGEEEQYYSPPSSP